jgi:uncharacterized protein YacL
VVIKSAGINKWSAVLEAFIESVTSNKVLLVIIVLSVSLIIYSIIKRLLKLVIIVIIALVLYLFYMNYTGQQPPGEVQKYYNEGVKELNKLQEKQEHINRINDSIKKLQE